MDNPSYVLSQAVSQHLCDSDSCEHESEVSSGKSSSTVRLARGRYCQHFVLDDPLADVIRHSHLRSQTVPCVSSESASLVVPGFREALGFLSVMEVEDMQKRGFTANSSYVYGLPEQTNMWASTDMLLEPTAWGIMEELRSRIAHVDGGWPGNSCSNVWKIKLLDSKVKEEIGNVYWSIRVELNIPSFTGVDAHITLYKFRTDLLTRKNAEGVIISQEAVDEEMIKRMMRSMANAARRLLTGKVYALQGTRQTVRPLDVNYHTYPPLLYQRFLISLSSGLHSQLSKAVGEATGYDMGRRTSYHLSVNTRHQWLELKNNVEKRNREFVIARSMRKVEEEQVVEEEVDGVEAGIRETCTKFSGEDDGKGSQSAASSRVVGVGWNLRMLEGERDVLHFSYMDGRRARDEDVRRLAADALWQGHCIAYVRDDGVERWIWAL